jgi:uncharacterized protein (DUF1697 family)
VAQQVYIALLRGINVGGNAIMKMADLKIALEKTTLTNVTTYIQSGNILFSAEHTSKNELESLIHDEILHTFDLNVAVVVKTKQEWQDIIENAPAWWGHSTEFKHNLLVLLHSYSADEIMQAIGTLKPDIEMAEAGNGVIYQSISINNFGRTNSGKIASNPIYKHMTIRNFNTSIKLQKLLNEVE